MRNVIDANIENMRKQIREAEKQYQETGNIAVMALLYSQFETIVKNMAKSRDEWAERVEQAKKCKDSPSQRESLRTCQSALEIKQAVGAEYLKALKKLFTKYGYDIVSSESDPEYIKPEFISDDTESAKSDLSRQLNKNLK